MNDSVKLGRDVFVALAAVGWADGHLDGDEADAIVRTALEEGLEIEEIAEIEAATKEPVDFESIDIAGMSKEDRLFVYAVATWMTGLDGVVTETEKASLGRLGEALRIAEHPRGQVDKIVRQVADFSEDDRPDRYDLPRLRRVLGERLRATEAARAAR